MSTDDLYSRICTYENLLSAFKRARKGKTTLDYVIEFEQNLEGNLFQLRAELLFHTYRPRPLKTFILRDPKTRKISKSAFEDRIVHHALCAVIEPIFEKNFIYDSYANRKGKGTLKAVERFHYFHRKISKNNVKSAYVLKADIRKYFETVDQGVLLSVIKKKISDQRIIWLIKIIFSNYQARSPSKGMPLGNLTSQFFANVYLHELDQYVKHTLKAKYYIRYVDDFVIFHTSYGYLQECKERIDTFLYQNRALKLHPEKSKIIPLDRGTEFLGFKIFWYHKIIKSRNLKKFYRTFAFLYQQYENKEIDYDSIYDFIEWWMAYARNANTHHLRAKILNHFEQKFSHEISTKEVNKTRKARQQQVRQIIKEVKNTKE